MRNNPGSGICVLCKWLTQPLVLVCLYEEHISVLCLSKEQERYEMS